MSSSFPLIPENSFLLLLIFVVDSNVEQQDSRYCPSPCESATFVPLIWELFFSYPPSSVCRMTPVPHSPPLRPRFTTDPGSIGWIESPEPLSSLIPLPKLLVKWFPLDSPFPQAFRLASFGLIPEVYSELLNARVPSNSVSLPPPQHSK